MGSADFVDAFSTSPFNTLVNAETYARFEGVDLDNDVHPIFAKENFKNDIDYNAIYPALQLATHLLLSESSLCFYHTIWNGPRETHSYPPGSGMEDKTYVRVFPPTQPLTPRQIRRIKKDLLIFAENIDYRFRDIELHIRGTTQEADGDVEMALNCRNFSGWASIITINKALYRSIVRARDPVNIKRGIPVPLWDFLEMAKLLLHEAAHAAGLFRSGDADEIMIGDAVIAEGGFDWENMVFGGILKIGRDDAMLYAWPSILGMNQYILNGCSLPITALPEEVQMSWSVPTAWMFRILTSDFWNVVVPAEGMDALKVPKILGVRMKAAACGCSTCSSLKQQSDGKSLIRLHEVSEEPGSPSCLAMVCEEMAADPLAADPLEGVPPDYTLLKSGKIVLKRFANRFLEPKVLGHLFVDARRGWKARRVETQGIKDKFRRARAAATKAAEAAQAV